jgi:hypothetical protein
LGIISAANLIGAAMSDDMIALLKVHEYFCGVSDEALVEVARCARITHHPVGRAVARSLPQMPVRMLVFS